MLLKKLTFVIATVAPLAPWRVHPRQRVRHSGRHDASRLQCLRAHRQRRSAVRSERGAQPVRIPAFISCRDGMCNEVSIDPLHCVARIGDDVRRREP